MPDPISGNEHHAHQLQELYHQNLKALIETISAALKKAAQQTIKGAKKAGEALKPGQQALKSNTAKELPIRLFVGGKEVYSQVPGQSPSINTITDKQFEKIKQSLEDPNNLKGAVEIKAGTERIFHAKNGELKVDTLDLAQTQTQKLEIAQAQKPPQETQTSPQSTPAYSESLTTEITSLTQTVEQQEQRIAALEKKIEILSQSLSSIQNKSLSKWMGSTLSTTAKGFKQAVTDWAANKSKNIKNFHQKAQSILKNALPVDHPLKQQMQGLENKVHTVSTNFEQGMMSVETRLAYIQQQLKDFYNNPYVQSTTKAALEKVIEPAVVSVLQRAGVIPNLEKLQEKSGETKQENVTKEARSTPNLSKEFKAEMVVSAASKLLDRIPAQTPDGNRSFQTGSGYVFEKKGDSITISNPDQSELVRSVGKDSERTIHVSEGLTAQKAATLEQIGDKIHQDLSPIQNQSQSLGVTQGARR